MWETYANSALLVGSKKRRAKIHLKLFDFDWSIANDIRTFWTSFCIIQKKNWASRKRERGYSLLWFLTAELGELLNIRRTPRMTRSVVASRTYRAGVPYQIWNWASVSYLGLAELVWKKSSWWLYTHHHIEMTKYSSHWCVLADRISSDQK